MAHLPEFFVEEAREQKSIRNVRRSQCLIRIIYRKER